MGQLKHYNPITQQWEPTIAGAQGPVGPQGADGYIGMDGESGIVAQPEAPNATDVLWLDTDEPGLGVPIGGTAGQVLAKVDSGDFNTEWVDSYTSSEVDTLLSSKSDSSHTHDDRYYTESETDTLLSGKSDTSHTHDDRYYTESEVDNAISTAIANVVDTAPALMDTLNELSASLNDDPSFATTVANALAALVPAGTISQTARSTAPTGYLLCDGSAVSRTTYATLFAAIGTAYGTGDGSTTFNIPNFKGRVPVGYDSAQTEFNALNKPGGAKTHTLAEAEMPIHTHTQNSHTHTYSGTTSLDGNHNHGIYYAGSTKLQYINTTAAQGSGMGGMAGVFSSDNLATGTNGSHTHTFSGTTSAQSVATNQNAGSGNAHNNLQPYVVVNYMIKI